MRARLRAKERKLQDSPGYRYLQAATDQDIDRLLDGFFAVKIDPHGGARPGNVFAEPASPSSCARPVTAGSRTAGG